MKSHLQHHYLLLSLTQHAHSSAALTPSHSLTLLDFSLPRVFLPPPISSVSTLLCFFLFPHSPVHSISPPVSLQSYQWLKEKIVSEDGRKQQAKLKELNHIAEKLGCTLPQLAVGKMSLPAFTFS